jgi:hypothetical protein
LRSWPVFAANHTHKCPPPVPILSQLHPVPTTPSNYDPHYIINLYFLVYKFNDPLRIHTLLHRRC